MSGVQGELHEKHDNSETKRRDGMWRRGKWEEENIRKANFQMISDKTQAATCPCH
jgi:hypothetical protein